jgi:hypothetical protein
MWDKQGRPFRIISGRAAFFISADHRYELCEKGECLVMQRFSEFWEEFKKDASILHCQLISGEVSLAFSRIDVMLRDAGLDFAFDLTSDADDIAKLVLTPEGDPVQANAIDALLQQAPSVPDWRFLGRRERKPLPDAFVIVSYIYDIDLRDALFLATKKDGRYGITMFMVGVDHLSEDEKSGLIATFLDHALGESYVMEHVYEMKINPCSKAPLGAFSADILCEQLTK